MWPVLNHIHQVRKIRLKTMYISNRDESNHYFYAVTLNCSKFSEKTLNGSKGWCIMKVTSKWIRAVSNKLIGDLISSASHGTRINRWLIKISHWFLNNAINRGINEALQENKISRHINKQENTFHQTITTELKICLIAPVILSWLMTINTSILCPILED